MKITRTLGVVAETASLSSGSFSLHAMIYRRRGSKISSLVYLAVIRLIWLVELRLTAAADLDPHRRSELAMVSVDPPAPPAPPPALCRHT